MKITELTTSKYIKQSDIDEPKLWTIRSVEKQNVAPPNEKPEYKGVMFFEESEKGMVLNPTNLMQAQFTCKSNETDDWAGHKIVVYVDPNVGYGGKITGGLRLRAPKPTKKPTIEELDNDIPFRHAEQDRVNKLLNEEADKFMKSFNG